MPLEIDAHVEHVTWNLSRRESKCLPTKTVLLSDPRVYEIAEVHQTAPFRRFTRKTETAAGFEALAITAVVATE